MADLTKTVDVIFGAIDNTGSVLGNIGNNFDSFADQASKVTEPLSNVAKYAELAGVSVGALGVALVAHSTSSFSTYQQSVIGLNKVLGEGEGSIDSYRETARALALQYGISSTVVLDGITNFKQAGFTAVEAAKLQQDAISLMIAGDVDGAKATDILIQSIKGFNLSVTETPRLIEAMNNVSNDYATDVNQLADGMSRIAPIADLMGFSFEEAAGLLTPIIEVFGSGSEAADALKTGLLKLTDDAKPVRDALASIGVAQTDANGQMRSGKDIYYDVAKAFETLDENQKTVLTSQLVGIEQTPRMIKVFDNLATVQAVTASAMKETGSVAKEMQARLDSLEVSANRNKVAWEELSIAIGEKLATGAKVSTDGLGNLGTALELAVKSGSFDAILNQIVAMNVGFGEFLAQVAKNLPDALKLVDFSGLVNSFKQLGVEFGDIFGGIDVSTPKGLADAIQFVVDSVESLTLVLAGIVNAWTPVAQAFFAGIDVFNNLDDSSKKYFGTVVGAAQVFETLKGAVSSGADAISVLAGVLNNLGTVLEAAAITKLSLSLVDLSTKAAGAVGVLGATGLVAAAGAAGFAIGTNLKGDVDELVTALTGSENTLGGWIFDVTHAGEQATAAAEGVRHFSGSFEDITKNTGVTVTNLYELDKAVRDGLLTFDTATGQYVAAGEGVQGFADSLQKAGITEEAWKNSVNGISDALISTKKATDETTQTFETHEQAMKALLAANSDLVNQSITYEDGLYVLTQTQKKATESSQELSKTAEQLAEETGKLTERQKLAIEQTNKLELQLNELASNERIKSMEFEANIKIANIQAQAQQVVAAFDEIGVAIQATQDAQAKIFDSLTNALGNSNIKWLDKDFLKSLAIEQQKQAQQALDDQSRLIDAQVNQLNARTNSLLSGQALISINADNLAPELQAVLRSLLEHIQIQANAEGLELLL